MESEENDQKWTFTEGCKAESPPARHMLFLHFKSHRLETAFFSPYPTVFSGRSWFIPGTTVTFKPRPKPCLPVCIFLGCVWRRSLVNSPWFLQDTGVSVLLSGPCYEREKVQVPHFEGGTLLWNVEIALGGDTFSAFYINNEIKT